VPIVSVAPKHRVRVWEFWGDSLPPAIEVVRGAVSHPVLWPKLIAYLYVCQDEVSQINRQIMK
jgi:hypothetical protein